MPVDIQLPERFTFQSHREFRTAYMTGVAPAERYAVDFRMTRFIDSAGLGMLLQLIEFAQNDPKRVHLINATPEIRQILSIAGFGSAATII